MPSSSNLFAISDVKRLGLLAVPLLMMGCGASDADEARTDAEELVASKVGVEGELTVGVPSYLDDKGTGKRYRAVRFTAHAGDRLAVVATAEGGDPVAYVLDAQMKTLATNDNAGPSQKESFIAFDVPADGTYYVAVQNKGTKTVEHVIGVRRRPASGTYTFPGTCRSGIQIKPLQLHVDFGYAAGSVGFSGLGYTPTSNVPGNLSNLLVQSYGVDLVKAIPSKITFHVDTTHGGYPWTESHALLLDLDKNTLEATWERYGATVSHDKESCTFDVSAIYAAPQPAGPFPASLEGKTLVAKGTCSGTNDVSSMCTPGTPGRDTNGCCSTGEHIGARPAELSFVVTKSNGNEKIELVSASSSQQSTISLGQSATQTSNGFVFEGVSIPFSNASLGGTLAADALSSHIRFSLSGSGTGGNTASVCAADRLRGSCELAWDAP